MVELLAENYFIEDIIIAGNLHISQTTKEQIIEECRKNLMIKAYVLPYLKNTTGLRQSLTLRPLESETHFKNYNVEELELWNKSFFRSDFIVKFIQMNKKDFHSLTLRNVHFDRHLKDLASYLKNTETRITKLVLEDCDIGDTSISQMIADCRVMTNLKELRLINMNLNHGNHTREILKALNDHKMLRILDLSHNQIVGLKEIGSLIVCNQNLQEIHLKDSGSQPIISTVADFHDMLASISKNRSVTILEYDIANHLMRRPGATYDDEETLPISALEQLEYQIYLNR